MRRNRIVWLIGILCLAAASAFGMVWLESTRDAGLSALKQEQYGTALEKLTLLAQVGDSTAQHMLGLMYAHGLGVPPDAAKAKYWLKRSTSPPFARSTKYEDMLYYVGRDIQDGVFHPRDVQKGDVWISEARRLGSKLASTSAN